MRKTVWMGPAGYVRKRHFARDTTRSAGTNYGPDTGDEKIDGTGNGSRKARRDTTGKARPVAPRRSAAAATQD